MEKRAPLCDSESIDNARKGQLDERNMQHVRAAHDRGRDTAMQPLLDGRVALAGLPAKRPQRA